MEVEIQTTKFGIIANIIVKIIAIMPIHKLY